MSSDPLSVSFEPLTPLTLLRRSADVYRDRPAVVYGEQRYSYAEFARRVHQLATALRSVGVGKGDRVAVLAPNIPPLLEAHFAVPLAGAILVAINTRLTAHEVTGILNHSEARVLIVDSELARLVEPSHLKSVSTFVNVIDLASLPTLPGLDYEAFLAAAEPADDFDQPDEHDTIAIDYTSGTTGQPKGVMYSHRGAYLNALGQILLVSFDNASVYLWTLPMFHCNGWCTTWGAIAAGATSVCLRRPDPAVIWDLVVREGVTHFNCAPTLLIALFNHPSAEGLQLPRPVQIATGGAPPSPTLIAQAEQRGAEIIHLYGLTETYGPFTGCEWRPSWNALPGDERARIRARQGVAHRLACELRVVDDEMRDVPSDGQTLGELVMRGNTIMKGYFKQPEATAEAFRGGWFHSGDLCIRHPDGYIELRDRKKDIIISGGENISTIEVEQAIAAHPAVLEVAVIAVPDAFWGEVPKAFVARRDGAVVTAEEIIAFCRERLAHFKCPKAVEFGELPKTSTGKIQKYVLREREWAGRETRI